MYDRKIIVILGPTASGKSALGVQLAKKFHGVVISADSRQVYRGLNIGTAKITKPEMRGVKHYLLDVASPRGQYSVARYVKDVQGVLKRLPNATPVFLVGGTPFYIKAITEPGTISTVPPNPKLRRRLEKMTATQLIAQLRTLDPARLKTIDQANRRRLERAIEIASTTPLAEGGRAGGVGARVLKLGLRVPRPKLYRRIDQRVDQRMNKLIAEVRKLQPSGLSWKRLESFGLEYRFASQFLQRKISYAEAANRIKFGSHDFARRQLTWWRRDHQIRWVRTPKRATTIVHSWLKRTE